jgi:hypothetical protein
MAKYHQQLEPIMKMSQRIAELQVLQLHLDEVLEGEPLEKVFVRRLRKVIEDMREADRLTMERTAKSHAARSTTKV